MKLGVYKPINATEVWFNEFKVYVGIEDGREVVVTFDWFPRLSKASPDQRNNWRFIAGGDGIHWEDLDEDLLVERLLR